MKMGYNPAPAFSPAQENTDTPPMIESLAFQALHYPDRLRVLNPRGDVGVATLWTPVATALEVLGRLGVDLSPESSRIAVIANLYGDGLPQMLRNLLWNPQIIHLLAFGQDLAGAGRDLEGFLQDGADLVEHLGNPKRRIAATGRFLDALLDPADFQGRYHLIRLGKPSLPETVAGITAFFHHLPPPALPPPDSARRDVPLPTYRPAYLPSQPAGHTIIRRRPLEAWEEVVFCLMRHGVPTIASRIKKRLELQNLKVVIAEPAEDRAAHLAARGFDLDDFHAYQRDILAPTVPEGLAYSYGNRLRAWWRLEDEPQTVVDCLEVAASRLAADPTTRQAYIALWDTAWDLGTPGRESGRPCLTTLFFRVFQDRLTLAATFRSHNALSAWLKNVYGLMAIQRFVAEKAGGLPCGGITIISHSISLDPAATDRMAVAQDIVAGKVSDEELDRDTGKRRMREDPHGYFVFSIDPDKHCILADHRAGNESLARYEGRTAQEIEHQIARDGAISLLSHALFVGRELTLQEMKLKSLVKGKKK